MFENTYKVLQEYSELLSETYKKNLPFATGELLKSITVTVTIKNKSYDIEMSLLNYWRWVEEGRRAGKMPPIEAIEDWIRAKKIVPDVRSKKTPSIRQLAFVIARKIGEKGTKPTNALKLTREALMADFNRKLSKALYEDLQTESGEILRVLRLRK